MQHQSSWQCAGGQRVEVQSWPLAYWPDGSLKWTGHAVTASAGLAGPFQLTPQPGLNEERGPLREIKYADDAAALTIDTGVELITAENAAG